MSVPDSANDPAILAVVRPPQLLVLEQGAQRVPRNGEAVKRDELWQGEARDPYTADAPPVPVYVRVTEPNPLVAELLCGLIARALGLPSPEAFVILLEPGRLPGSVLAKSPERQLCVGTRDIGGSTFAQLLNEESATAQAMLRGWEHLVPVTALDEWLANTDRNFGNILYVAQTLHIIDHAEAFGGSARDLFPLADITHEAFTNKLAIFLNRHTADHRQGILNKAREWLAFSASGLDVAHAVAMANIRRWQSSEEESELIHFISTRLTITHRLLCQRLGHPQLALHS